VSTSPIQITAEKSTYFTPAEPAGSRGEHLGYTFRSRVDLGANHSSPAKGRDVDVERFGEEIRGTQSV
jgi:hypothetical protein